MIDRHPNRATALLALLLLLLLVAASGCGRSGDGGPSDVRAGGAAADAPVIATLGDSIVAGSPRWDPDERVRGSFTDVDRDSQWQRWVDTDATLRNCGVWGERTDEIAARYDRCTRGATAVVIQGGINDIAQGRSVADAAHTLACLGERARRDGLRVAYADVLPWNRGFPDTADAIDDLNDRIHDIARRGGVPVLAFHDVLDDPEHPGRMPEDLTVEGDHPNVAGYRLLGERAWRAPTRATGSFATDCQDVDDA